MPVLSDTMEYVHNVIIRCDDNEDFDDPNRETLTFRSTARYFVDMVEQIKAAVKEWLASVNHVAERELDNAIYMEYGEHLSNYYRPGIDRDMTEEELEDEGMQPISELVVNWKMVFYYLPVSIAEKHGFTTDVATSDNEDSDFNFNA